MAGRPRGSRSGFTLIELLVVVLIIGILAAIAVPQYFKVVEKGRLTEALNWFTGLKNAQERYLAKYGSYYTGSIAATTFDVNLGTLSKFNAGAATSAVVAGSPTWSVTLTRGNPIPSAYGPYTLTYTGPAGTMACGGTGAAACTADLLP